LILHASGNRFLHQYEYCVFLNKYFFYGYPFSSHVSQKPQRVQIEKMTFTLGQRMVRITGIFQALLAAPVTIAAGSLAL
jgi:hypothetical protein